MSVPAEPSDSAPVGDGDEAAAFTALYAEHYAAVRSYSSVCVPASEVDDVVADTFLVVWRRLRDVPTDWTRGWLIGVARNVVHHRHRAARRRTNFIERLAQLTPESITMLHDGHVPIEDLQVLAAAFARLKPADQEILVLSGPYDLPHEEIAVAMGIKPNAVAVRIHRARARLRTAYDAQLADDGAAA